MDRSVRNWWHIQTVICRLHTTEDKLIDPIACFFSSGVDKFVPIVFHKAFGDDSYASIAPKMAVIGEKSAYKLRKKGVIGVFNKSRFVLETGNLTE